MTHNRNNEEQEVWKTTFKIAAPLFLVASLVVVYMIAGYNLFFFEMPEQPSEDPSHNGTATRKKWARKHSSGKSDNREDDKARDLKNRLSDAQMISLSEKMLGEIKLSKEQYSNAVLNKLATSHPEYKPRDIKNPFKDHMIWSVLLDTTQAAPNRTYMVVSRQGKIYWPYSARDFKKMVKKENTSGWDDDAYFNAALLFVHISSPTSQDGWRTLRSARDFLSIIKTKALTREIALAEKEIHSAQVKRENKTVIVDVCSWHWAGGVTRKWSLVFSDDFQFKVKDLGVHGGGTYEEREEKKQEEAEKKKEESSKIK